MKVVVCDDDVTIRAVASRIATETGHSVLAETDSATDAVDMVIRFGAEVLILELALPWGAGLQALRELREGGAACETVVFTSYAADSPEVLESGVRAVIEKPDFEGLERVLADLAAGITTTDGPAAFERRQPIEARPEFPPHGPIGPSGLEHPVTFQEAAGHLKAGDGVIVVHVAGTEQAAGWFGRITAHDQVLAVARLMRSLLRAQDRLTLDQPEPDAAPTDIIALLLGGGRPGIDSLWRRLEKGHEAASLHGVINAGFSVCDDTASAGFAISRARDAASRSIGRPLGDRLWMG